MGTSVQNFFTSRDNNVDPATYVGQLDRLWYNPDTNQIFISDGSTPGGRPVDLGANANALINTLTVSNITSLSGVVQIVGNLAVSGNITPATDTKIGGVRAGPGANISNTGLLTIDTTGLPLSFGNFTASNNILTIVNSDENMILETSGNAEIQLVGNIGFYKSNGGGAPDPEDLYFNALEDGQIFIYVPDPDSLTAGVDIIGSTTGNTISPGISGAMLHITGQANIPCRVYYDGNNNYVSWVARRWNGNVSSPSQVLAGQDVLRINATAATDAGVGNIALAQIQFQALENQTTTAQGSALNFVVTPIGSPANARVEVANITVANGVTATKFTTAGNVTAGNVITDRVVSIGNIEFEGNLIPASNVYTLGSASKPWADAFFGPQSITILDESGNIGNSVIIQNIAANIVIGTTGFTINEFGTSNPVFRIEALTGQIFSAANTIITNATDAANISSGSLQTTGGAGIAKNLYVGGNISSGNVAAATFTGNVVGNVTGTASTATNLAAATSILAGTLTIDPANINKTSASTQTFTLTGLTTSHKVLITAGTALDYGVSIVSAWASALNTLSITFHNYSGAGVNLGSTNIQYFAWV